jgi:hypothetical protein
MNLFSAHDDWVTHVLANASVEGCNNLQHDQSQPGMHNEAMFAISGGGEVDHGDKKGALMSWGIIAHVFVADHTAGDGV